jgi:hypothetical protein
VYVCVVVDATHHEDRRPVMPKSINVQKSRTGNTRPGPVYPNFFAKPFLGTPNYSLPRTYAGPRVRKLSLRKLDNHGNELCVFLIGGKLTWQIDLGLSRYSLPEDWRGNSTRFGGGGDGSFAATIMNEVPGLDSWTGAYALWPTQSK